MKMSMNPEELDLLLSFYASGEISKEGELRLAKWASESEENGRIMELLDSHSPMGSDIILLDTYQKDKVWKGIIQADRTRTKKRNFRRIVRYSLAACLLVSVAMGALFLLKTEDQPAENNLSVVIEPGNRSALLQLSDGRILEIDGNSSRQIHEADQTLIDIDGEKAVFLPSGQTTSQEITISTLQVPAGKEFSLVLSDGTQVWLNSGSCLTFPTVFGGDVRAVELSGEAYFEVSKDADKPFVVTCGQQTITVLGTSFNLSAYDEDSLIETTLLSGSVKLQAPFGERVLFPGQQLRFDRKDGSVSICTVNAELYSAWTKGMFVFFDEPVSSICRKLSRWYEVEIEASDPALDDVRYSGMIDRNSTFNKIADLMASTNEVFFVEKNGKVIAKKKD